MLVFVRFYFGRSLPALAVRWATRWPRQRLSDVPSHCALAVEGTLSEFTVAGFSSRPAAADDSCLAVGVLLPDGAALTAFLAGRPGGKYDWWAVGLDALARFAPPGLAFTDRLTAQMDCSRFVFSGLCGGGWTPPGWLLALGRPPSPNDLLLALTGRTVTMTTRLS